MCQWRYLYISKASYEFCQLETKSVLTKKNENVLKKIIDKNN